MTDDNRVSMRLSFDADQVTSALHCHFEHRGRSIYQPEGRCAGTYHFPKDADMEFLVTGSAASDDEMKFTIRDLTLVSVSTLSAGRAPLSMFADDCACVRIGDWKQLDPQTAAGRQSTTMQSATILKMPAKDGQWTLSGYLSVIVEKNDKSGKRTSEPRLFLFDPEGTMGTGGDVRT